MNAPSPAAGPDHPLFRAGAQAAREGDLFAAHEEWEVLWRAASGDERALLQALIQVAAAGLHLRAGREGPARRLLASAHARLEPVPESFWGVDVRGLRSALAAGTREGTPCRAPGLAALLPP
ncbi:MAG: DUF309 domain-containing protein [Acidobacteria bacterium ACB2]|nr:DUF309 domain-containing protein [Acidobacteria bacterium ACB2]